MGAMFFEKKVDRRSRKAMADFLVSHARYSTMNSWNGMDSYANCIKINQIGLNSNQYDRAWEVISAEDYWSEVSWPIQDFTAAMRGEWTIGVNGRSGGYLVLYRSTLKDSGYRSYCPTCGQQNYRPVSEASSECGVCRNPRIDYEHPPKVLRTSMAGVDQGEDFADWSMERLRERVDLVCRFDRTCDEIRSEFVHLCERAQVVEKTEMVPRTSKVLVLTD